MAKHTLSIGKTVQLRPAWSSADTSIATVDRLGKVKAVGRGTVEIYCTVDDVSVATIVAVTEPTPPLVPANV